MADKYAKKAATEELLKRKAVEETSDSSSSDSDGDEFDDKAKRQRAN